MYKLVEDLAEVAEFLSKADVVGLDIETTALHPRDGVIRLIQLSNSDGEILITDCFKLSADKLKEAFSRLFDKQLKLVIHNVKFELSWFKYHFNKTLNSYFDTYLAAKLIDFQAKAGLGDVVEQYLGVEMDKSEQVSNWAGELTKSQLDYAAADVQYLLPLREELLKRLKSLKLIEAATLEFGCIPAVASMELAGFPVNLDRFYAFIEDAERKRDLAFADLNKFLLSGGGKKSYDRTYVVDLFGNEVDTPNEVSVNLRSQQQLIEKFKEAGIDIDTTDKKMIAIYAQQHPELKLLLDFREQEKLCSTYGREFIKKHVREDGRIYGSFLQFGAVTGRFASRNPNNQNQPSTKQFRKIFQPKEGRRFIVSDMAQFELRILGSFSNDVIMLDAFNAGKDLHSVTTEQIFGIPYAECKLDENKHKRTQAKICFSGDTEVLTEFGWIRFDSYKGCERVLQFELPDGISYNPPLPKSNRWGIPTGKQVWDGKGTVSFVKPLDFQKFEHEPLYYHSDRNTDFLMTANHNVIYVDGNGRARKTPAIDINAGNIDYIPASGIFNYPSLKLTSDETRFLAMFAADGSITSSKYIKFGFHKERKVERCRNLLKALNIIFSEHTNDKEYKITCFNISYKNNKDFVDKILKYIDRNKILNANCIMDVDGYIFLEEASHWDSHVLKNKTSRRRVIFLSENKETIDIMQIMACMNGIQSRVRYGKYSILSYRMPTRERFEGRHSVSWNLQPTGLVQTVYCVQVPSGAFIIRRNGKTAVTGNCNFSIAYGIGGEGLSLRLKGEGIDSDAEGAQKLIDDWYEAYPQAGKWLKNQRGLVNKAKKNLKEGAKGFVEIRGVDGRLIKPNFIVGDFSSEGGAKRDCQNFPIQSCVAGNSKVYTTEGIYKIEDLAGKDNLKIWNGKEFVQCGGVVASGKKQLVKVNLHGGYTLYASKDHKFWCCGTDGKYTWRTVEEIKNLKHVWLKMTDQLDFDSINLPQYSDSSFIKNTERKPIHLAMIENKFDMGVFLGRIASDGDIRAGYVSLTVAKHELEVLTELQRIAGVFGYTEISKQQRRQYKPIYRLNISSKALAEELMSLKIKQEIPAFVLNDRDILRGYLRGLFDGGTVSSNNIVNAWGGNISSKAEWASNVQHALLQLGIRSRLRIYKKEKNSSIRLSIMKADCSKFVEIIGFINSKKQAKVATIQNTHHPKVSTIYGFASKMKSVEFTDEIVEMYDVLDSDTHSFCVDGFVSHNCNAVAIKRALTNLHKILEEKYPSALIVNCVHDEIVVECDEADADDVCVIVKNCMEEGGSHYMKNVKIEADAKVCLDWSEK